MSMATAVQPEIKMIGISARTTNAQEAGPEGLIPGLWKTLYSSSIAAHPGIANPEFTYVLYTDYESDATGAYTVVIGHEISNDAFQGEKQEDHFIIPAGKYVVFKTKKGPVFEVIPQAWRDIWAYFENSVEKRAYTGDFERYDTRGFDPSSAEVEIYIAVK
ncbi:MULTISPECIES: GyrI-like domain-containing protein [Paenibacillus]|uniref:GyrI-like domain-containing protein n=1 Tax=Paenibacillus TaxID=44249 RepID=UPI0022B930B9|nr:GyrI-like domain-containing protein [Paenibacillus caseinilyticus]MCZ8522033.1 GyrI-like domain-containing protein [Paenibacillus caseinilyticus]